MSSIYVLHFLLLTYTNVHNLSLNSISPVIQLIHYLSKMKRTDHVEKSQQDLTRLNPAINKSSF
jgi:hypothetical protein